MVFTKVEKLEPLPLRKEWMNDLAQAVAFLETLNLAHGDLRPENILLDRNRQKLSDFDCTAEIGTNYEACMAPYGRILNSNETDQGECGTFGFLSPRTEQFALGSLFYFINYGPVKSIVASGKSKCKTTRPGPDQVMADGDG